MALKLSESLLWSAATNGEKRERKTLSSWHTWPLLPQPTSCLQHSSGGGGGGSRKSKRSASNFHSLSVWQSLIFDPLFNQVSITFLFLLGPASAPLLSTCTQEGPCQWPAAQLSSFSCQGFWAAVSSKQLTYKRNICNTTCPQYGVYIYKKPNLPSKGENDIAIKNI